MRSKIEDKNDNQKTAKTVRLDDVHWEIIRKLIPFYGNTEPEVVRTIIVMWLHDNSSSAIRKLEEIRELTNKK